MAALKSHIEILEKKLIIYVDIDDTICISPLRRDYSQAKPIEKNIKKINRLYDQGNIIVYWTARGTGSGIDWRDVTEKQFADWGVKYHELKFGKPIYDIFVVYKNINAESFFDDTRINEMEKTIIKSKRT